jgi:Tol biopolymer transport system component
MKKLILLLSMMFSMPAFAKDVMLMNRLGPSVSELYVSDADGTGEHKLFATTGFDYHASFSYEGKWVVFTSERTGYGQSDIYRAHSDGTGLERLTDDPALDDQGFLSPDGTQGGVCFRSRDYAPS